MTRLFGVLLLVLALGGCRDETIQLGDPDLWTAHPADGVALDLTDDEGALRLDFAFSGGGYAIARREVDFTLPANYLFRFRLRGEAPANHLEFKLVDGSGQNVWWKVDRDVDWPGQWQTVTIKKRQIEFAWGPQGGGEPDQVAAIEFAVTAGSGGRGTLWIEGLELVPLPEVTGPPPRTVVTASSAQTNHPATLVQDGDPETFWFAGVHDEDPALILDFGGPREYGGLTVTWGDGTYASEYRVEVSDDGRNWETLSTVTGGGGGRDHLYLPETESSWLRLQLGPQKWESPPEIAELVIRPLDWSATREAFFMNIASESPRGMYPQGLLGEPTAWTVVGVDGDRREGLLGATGALEARAGEFSLEPFLWIGSQLVTWDDVIVTQSLAGGYLPIPKVEWVSDSWRLTVTALGTGDPGDSALLARYRLENRGAVRDSATLYLGLRPFQVNPPVQFLNIRGGTARIGSIALRGREVAVDGRVGVRFLQEPDGFGAAAFAAGDIVADYLAKGQLPRSTSAADGFGAASAAAAYHLILDPGSETEVEVVLPLYGRGRPPELPTSDDALAWSASTELAAEQTWRRLLDGVTIEGPLAAQDAIATLRAQLGFILVNRAGVGFQPGARSYARSWIRDGALTGVALLRLGHAAEVRDFLTWYAPHQYDNGKIPCVVDWRGADPVPEHDSTGEFIYLVAEYYRYTGDREMVDSMWPRVQAGVRYLEFLLAQRSTPEYRSADSSEFYGILPPSISHEGYSAKPMHSYWDDFFALRGLKDAAWLAEELQDPGVDSLATLRDTFARNLGASIAAAMARHGIAYVPGCADLGDFDATSTTIALDPASARDIIPSGALEQTFEDYWTFFDRRAKGEPWEAFTPYEIRNIGAFVRLGWRDRAQKLLEFFLDHRTPPGWRQWAEVVASDSTVARFIGDMPHTWVGSDYVRSFLDLFAYERRDGADGPATLVLAAGVPTSWLENGGIKVAGLPTPYGSLDYVLFQEKEAVWMKIGKGITPPSGGLLLAPPIGDLAATIDGAPAKLDPSGRVVVLQTPVIVRWLP